MKRFRFRLERLARVREVQEELARATWAGAEREAREGEEQADALAEALRAAQRELVAARRDPRGGAARALVAERTLDTLAERLRSARERARTRRAQADRLRDAWRERERDVAALERLEERARERHQLEAGRAEALVADEAAARRDRALRESVSGPGPAASDHIRRGRA